MKNMIRVRKHYRRVYQATTKDKLMTLSGRIQGALYWGNWNAAIEYATEIERLSPDTTGLVDCIIEKRRKRLERERRNKPTHTTYSTTVKPIHVGFMSVLLVLCFILGL